MASLPRWAKVQIAFNSACRTDITVCDHVLWSGTGSQFQSQTSPKPVVQVGAPGSTGTMEITDIIFSTRGPAPGAIVVEWNVKGSSPAAAGTWDTHIRLGSGECKFLQC